MVDLSRRGFLGGLSAGLIAAPAIVRAASLMPVRALKIIPPLYSAMFDAAGNLASVTILDAGSGYTSPPLVTILDSVKGQFLIGSEQYNALGRCSAAIKKLGIPTQLITRLEANEDEQSDLV